MLVPRRVCGCLKVWHPKTSERETSLVILHNSFIDQKRMICMAFKILRPSQEPHNKYIYIYNIIHTPPFGEKKYRKYPELLKNPPTGRSTLKAFIRFGQLLPRGPSEKGGELEIWGMGERDPRIWLVGSDFSWLFHFDFPILPELF